MILHQLLMHALDRRLGVYFEVTLRLPQFIRQLNLRLTAQDDQLHALLDQPGRLPNLNGCFLLVPREHPHPDVCLYQFFDCFGDAYLQFVLDGRGAHEF